MDIKKLKELKPEELKERLVTKQEELVTVKYEIKMGQEKDNKKPGKLKKEIARIQTILNNQQ
jgi:ribosomal protein L29